MKAPLYRGNFGYHLLIKTLAMEHAEKPHEKEQVMNEIASIIVDGMLRMNRYEKFKYLERMHKRLDGKAGRVLKRTFNIIYSKQYAEVYESIILFIHHNSYKLHQESVAV